ncbi:MAG: hypothetical protein PSV23_07305 [Brevundimonas sp.]|uniref:hypothetical protein n=1 Tax=Brevundimonas sp. TaxID=1871086 RepID=UPI00248A2995|nr:hypothetical protein [Brevundimonas sp.]MDI1326591.1 hypothetical protein [Brevundimonas sp.]
MTSARRRYAHNAYGRTADAFETVAWRPPVARRVDARPANDGYGAHHAEPSLKEMAEGLPAWFTIVVGGAVAALMGALLGGALQV